MILTVVWMRFGSGLGRLFNPGQVWDRFETFLSGGDRTGSPSLGQGGVRFWSSLSLVFAWYESDISDSFRLNRLGQVSNRFGKFRTGLSLIRYEFVSVQVWIWLCRSLGQV